MALSKERIGEIALVLLLAHFEQEGLTLKPKEIGRDVANRAKKLGLDEGELSEFTIFVIEGMAEKTLNSLGYFPQIRMTDKVEEA